ncbi:MAG: hypothetical protein QNJ97_16205 [Myxococcota bacterium]|nr:hypothetical protein [Myxococcota bacterium]
MFPNHYKLLCGVFALLLPKLGMAEFGLRGLDYQYVDDKLHLKVHAADAGTLLVQYRSVDHRCQARGRMKKKRFEVVSGENNLTLDANTQHAHQIQLVFDDARIMLLANRGAWFVAPQDKYSAGSRTAAYLRGFDARNDTMLAAGFGASVGLRSAPDKSFSVARTLGADQDYGLCLDRGKKFLVVVLKSNARSIGITLSERLDSSTMRYWDYRLSVNTALSRYEIPINKFQPRDGTKKPIKAIHSITITPQEPVAAGDRISIAYLGLSAVGPSISQPVASKDGRVFADISGPVQPSSAIYTADGSGMETQVMVKAKHLSLPASAEKMWLCYTKPNVHAASVAGPYLMTARICDPPDAPLSTYGVPVGKGAPLIIDRFDTPVWVNAFRMPAGVFGSSSDMERTLTRERLANGLRLTYYPDSEDDYAGYLTYLPKAISKQYQTLAITLKGSIPPNHILVGVKNAAGKEARIPIISYWPGDETEANPLYDMESIHVKKESSSSYLEAGFRTVFIPIDAFEAVFYNVFKGHAYLDDIHAVSVTMTYGGKTIFHELELKRIALIKDRVPVSITAFDGDHYGINALGGVNFSEHDRGGLIDVRLNADGYYGQGLRVVVTLDRPESYGLVALGFGRLDVRDYASLSFSVRGEHGADDARIYLNDGKNRAYVHLKDFIGLTSMWRKASIPLSVFKEQGVKLNRLSQVVLAWEEERMYDRILYFDNFFFE